jgi:tetratricopeptide (TPR) repeat protein
LFRLVEELTTGLLAGLDVDTSQAPGLQQVTTSEEAFRAFSEGKGLYQSLRYEEAAARFRDSIAADPEFSLAWLHLATSLFSAGDTEAGVASIQQSLARADALPPAARLLAQALDAFYRERNFKKAAGSLQALVVRFPRDAEAYVWWARAHADLEQDPMQAMRRLRDALAIDPDNVPALVTLARELAKLGSVDDAQRLLRQTAERHPAMRDAIHDMLQGG